MSQARSRPDRRATPGVPPRRTSTSHDVSARWRSPLHSRVAKDSRTEPCLRGCGAAVLALRSSGPMEQQRASPPGSPPGGDGAHDLLSSCRSGDRGEPKPASTSLNGKEPQSLIQEHSHRARPAPRRRPLRPHLSPPRHRRRRRAAAAVTAACGSSRGPPAPPRPTRAPPRRACRRPGRGTQIATSDVPARRHDPHRPEGRRDPASAGEQGVHRRAPPGCVVASVARRHPPVPRQHLLDRRRLGAGRSGQGP
jgi:hypothetical protein